MKKLLREPLLHFLLIGAGLFLLAVLRSGRLPFQFGAGQAQAAKIVISAGDVESLIANFTNLWQRPPTEQELNGLIEGRVREEVYYREALKMGLDRDDTIIRSRLQEKLEFLSQDFNKVAEPSEGELKAFLAQHPEKFRTGAEYSFALVFVDAGRHGASTRSDAESILARLGKNPQLDAAAMGDPLPFPRSFDRMAEADVAKMFGSAFAAALPSLKQGQWDGPLASEDGVYLVEVKGRREGRLPALDEIRPAVRQEWMAAQRQQANDKFYRNLLQRYSVSVALPKGVRAQARSEAAR